MSTILQAQNVEIEFTVRHGLFRTFKHQALRGISLGIERGETLGVLGRNGSGKSTLLQLLAGLTEPSRGNIVLPTGNITRALLSLGLGFRGDLSGAENVLLSLALQGYSRRGARELLPRIKEFAELGEFFEEPVRTYSAGMRARLGFATGTNSNVDLLLIDEVLGVGDLKFRKKAVETMKAKLESDQTIVLVSQNPNQIKELCDRAIWIHEGQIREIGDPTEVGDAYSVFMNSD